MMFAYTKIRKKEGLYVIKPPLFFAVLMVSFFATSAFAATLARVNQTPIEAREIKAQIQVYLRKIGHKRLSPLRMASLEKEVLKKAIEEELLYQEALNNDLSVSAVEIAAGLKKIRRRFPSEQAYLDGLSKAALSLDDLERGVSRSILIQKSWQRLSQMDETTRSNRVREMTKAADIEIFETETFTGLENE
ncbi:hypothetical protein MNBD_NITROSPIRAE01-1857 [hydrothermal vent metagenome]|uniref:PpiC domain-containing protein n=1 Tax=hydrothermal vent metagenome TaxID=652676 RepID=A0A3B1DK17_9ZZZZ